MDRLKSIISPHASLRRWPSSWQASSIHLLAEMHTLQWSLLFFFFFQFLCWFLKETLFFFFSCPANKHRLVFNFMAWGLWRAYVCMNTGGVYGILLIKRISIKFRRYLQVLRPDGADGGCQAHKGSMEQLGSSGGWGWGAGRAAAAGQMQEVKKCLWTLTSSYSALNRGWAPSKPCTQEGWPGQCLCITPPTPNMLFQENIPAPHPGWSHLLLAWAIFRSRFWWRRKWPTFQSYQKGKMWKKFS